MLQPKYLDARSWSVKFEYRLHSPCVNKHRQNVGLQGEYDVTL